MKRNQDRVRKNASHPATHSQVKITQTKASSAAAAQNRKPLTFSFTGESGAEVIRLSLDERYACLLKRVSEATGLAWCDLLNFILDRQLEAFFPDGDRDVFSVRLDATSKITEGFRKAQRAATALRAVTEIMTDRLQEFKQHHPLPDRGFLAELSGLFSLVQHLSVRADVEVADATMYWDISARPVLLESRVAMPLVEQLTVKAA